MVALTRRAGESERRTPARCPLKISQPLRFQRESCSNPPRGI